MRTLLHRVLPVPQEPVSERRGKYVSGLQFRAITAAVFFALFLVLEQLSPSERGRYVSVLPVMAILAFVNLPFWYLGQRYAFTLRHFYLHWFIDLIIISITLHMLGGVDAPYGFFAYLMIVVTSATFISKRASFMVAGGATVATSALVGLEASGIVSHVDIWAHHLTPEVQLVTVAVAVAFYFMFAYLAGTLAEQLKAANLALGYARTEIEQQNRLLEEKVTERTSELQRRNSEIEEFVHIVTHDLKNLSVGATETARKLIALEAERLSPRSARYAQHLMEDARAMNEMLKHLLAIFRIDQERRHDQRISMRDLAEDVIKTQASRLEAKGIKLTLGELPTIFGDEAQVRHVLTNLLDNAIKYVGDKPDPTIRLHSSHSDGQAVITVTDNGVGVARDQQERIFHLYHRAPDQSVAGDLQAGDGVGLAICKRIVERWGGRIWVRSSLGQGSDFSFTVPLSPSREPLRT